MTLYCMIFGCGFHWQLGGMDICRDHRVIFDLHLFWRDKEQAKCVWRLTTGYAGVEYTEKSPRRTGTWRARGPFEKVA